MENPVRKLRKALGISQQELAVIIGRSYQSVRNYERSLQAVPPEVVDRLKTLAAENGLADLALQLSSDDWQVAAVFHPGETLISQGQKQTDDRKHWHALLDEILDSDAEDAVYAVKSNLFTFGNYVRGQRAKRTPVVRIKKT
jgi:transcriptional regulator with XRE-family HTH domain